MPEKQVHASAMKILGKHKAQPHVKTEDLGSVSTSDANSNHDDPGDDEEAEKSASKSDAIWSEALKRWRAELGKEDNQQISKVPNYQALQKSILSTKKQYKDRFMVQLLNRIEPLISRLRTFSVALDTFAQAHSVLVLLWGSLKVLITLATLFKEVFESIVKMFEKIDSHLPRFEIYLKAFPSSYRLEQSVLELYSEIINFSIQSIGFLRKHPIRNLIRSAWSSFESIFSESLTKIEALKAAVELEAFAANVEGAIARHEEIKSLLENRKVEATSAIKLPCHVILFPRNAKFFGRTAILERIGSCVLPEAEVSRQRSLAVVGFGGTGKTQAVLEFVWRHIETFQVVLWAQSDSWPKLEQAFIDFGRRLGLLSTQSSSDTSQNIETVKNWLESADMNWLVVFDNVEENTVLKTFWPVSKRGSIILTARNLSPSFSTAAEIFHLPCFAAEEGTELLLHLLPQGSLGSAPESQRSSALELSKKLGGLALALAQVAGFVASAQCTLQEMVEIYEQQQSSEGELPSPNGPVDFYYEHTLNTVWTATFSRMSERSNFFLGLLSFLDPDIIPEDLFMPASLPVVIQSIDFFPKTKFEYFEILGKLRTYDLVKRDSERKFLSIHRLVQKAVIKRMSHEHKSLILEALITLLSYVYPKQSLGMAMDRFWEQCELFLPQVLAVASHFRFVNGKQKFYTGLAELLHNATWYMQEKGMFEQLLPVVETGLSVIRSVGEEGSLLMGEMYNTLGNVYFEIGNFGKSEDYFLKVKKIREENCSPGDPPIANISNNLSLVKTALGQFQEAADLSYNVIQLRESLDDSQYKAYKENTLPINYSNLCRILYTMGNLDEAAKIGEQAISLAKNAFGLKSKNTAQAIYNFADVRMKQGHSEALKFHLHALSLRKDVLGSHYSTAGSCYKVALFFLQDENLTSAKELLEDALEMYQHAYSAKGGIARTLYSLAEIAERENKAEVARSMKAKAQALKQQLNLFASPEEDSIACYDALIPYMDR